jgi:hypothetical protein
MHGISANGILVSSANASQNKTVRMEEDNAFALFIFFNQHLAQPISMRRDNV